MSHSRQPAQMRGTDTALITGRDDVSKKGKWELFSILSGERQLIYIYFYLEFLISYSLLFLSAFWLNLFLKIPSPLIIILYHLTYIL